MSANGGHFTIDVVMYGLAPERSCCATCIQLSRSSECAEAGHAAMRAARTIHAEPTTTSMSSAAGGTNPLHRARAAVAVRMRGI
jgi:hypothetical protein